MAEVGTIDVLGYECVIHAHKSGSWAIQHDGRAVGHGETLDAARAQARKELKKLDVKVEVPFITKAGERGLADGFHAKNRTVLGTVAGERIGAGGIADRVFNPEIPAEEILRYGEADATIRQARAVQKEIDDEWEINLSSRVRHEMDKAVADA